MLYALCRRATRLLGPRQVRPHCELPAPSYRTLLCLTAAIAAVTFAVRLRYPLDTWVPFLDFLQLEPARLPQYAAFFTLGALTHRHGWLERFEARTGWVWLTGGLAGVAVLFAVGADASCSGSGGLDTASALRSAYGSALCVGLLTLFREAPTVGGRSSGELAADSYTVYIIHLPLVVTLQYHFARHGLSPVSAWATVSAAAVPTAFVLAAWLLAGAVTQDDPPLLHRRPEHRGTHPVKAGASRWLTACWQWCGAEPGVGMATTVWLAFFTSPVSSTTSTAWSSCRCSAT